MYLIQKNVRKSIDKIKVEWYYIINPKEIQNKQKRIPDEKGNLENWISHIL